MDERLDDLTRLLNRKSLWEELERLFAAAESDGTSVTLVVMDLDQFKSFNDEQGHAMGDELIRKFADILSSNCRPGDVVGRYGGEEFVLAMPDTLPEEALLMLEDLRRQVSTTTQVFQIGDRRLDHRFTFSGGIAAFPRDGREPRDVLRAADSALYTAKVNGRDRLALAMKTRMVLKSNYYPKAQLEKLAELGTVTGKTEAFLLREALDDLLVKYKARPEAVSS